MYYICIEDGKVVAALNYLPEVPATVKVVEVTKAEFDGITIGTKKFDPQNQVLVDSEIDHSRNEKLNFLKNTDWLVLRHLREKALRLNTSLSEEEFLNLEAERQVIAMSI
jgi:hypothetical protein